MFQNKEFSELLGLTIKEIVNNDYDEIKFLTECGRTFNMCHIQDCCEQVSIEDIAGDLNCLIGNPILQAEESSSSGTEHDSGTWTFYKLATIKGYVTIRWYGISNGYYSERVDFLEDCREVGLKAFEGETIKSVEWGCEHAKVSTESDKEFEIIFYRDDERGHEMFCNLKSCMEDQITKVEEKDSGVSICYDILTNKRQWPITGYYGSDDISIYRTK